jgi:hypothetical protein
MPQRFRRNMRAIAAASEEIALQDRVSYDIEQLAADGASGATSRCWRCMHNVGL